MKQYHLAVMFFLAFLCSQAQTKDPDDKASRIAIKKSAETMVEHFGKSKYEEYITFVHPKIVQMLGGKQRMIESLKSQMNQMKDQGFTFKTASIGNPSKVVQVEGELQSVVSQSIELTNAEGVLSKKSSLVAISKDDGKNWYFIDTGGKTLSELKKVFKTLSDDLTIPPEQEAKFTPN